MEPIKSSWQSERCKSAAARSRNFMLYGNRRAVELRPQHAGKSGDRATSFSGKAGSMFNKFFGKRTDSDSTTAPADVTGTAAASAFADEPVMRSIATPAEGGDGQFEDLSKERPSKLDARCRFGVEAAAMRELLERFGLDQILNHLDASDDVRPFHEFFLAQQLRLTELLAPRLFVLLRETQKLLGFDEAVDLYVTSGAEVNAGALHRLDDDLPHVISLSSETIRSMNDDELRFVFGHELGHLIFNHYRPKTAGQILAYKRASQAQESGRSLRPSQLERRLDRWNRLAEISADRVGLMACGGKLEVAVSVFFRMASGLGPEHLCYDISAFLGQLARLKEMTRPDVMARFSHPVTPVRARAVQIWHALLNNTGDGATAEAVAVDGEIEQLLGLMEYELSTDLGKNARDFLIGAGLLAAHADGTASQEEENVIIELLLHVTGDPEMHLNRVKTLDDAKKLVTQSAKWLVENSGQERFALFGQIAHIVAIDGRISSAERRCMDDLAALLHIPPKSASEIIHEVLSAYVQTKAAGSGLLSRLGDQ
jgi:uncharacterized tellurite resistance protein B-like protein